MSIWKTASIVLMGVLILALVVFYSLCTRPRSSSRILAAKDTSDMPTQSVSPTKASYDPYFSRVNLTRDIVILHADFKSTVREAH